MRYFIGTEFIDTSTAVELISLAIVAEDGRELYVQSVEFTPHLASDWVEEHVFTHLALCPHNDAGEHEQDLTWDLNGHYNHGQCTFSDPEKGTIGGQTDCLWRTCEQIALEIRAFCDPEKYGKPELYGWCAGYDFVVLCQVFGTMMDLPEGFPHYIRDLQYLLDARGLTDDKLPPQTDQVHNALADARYLKRLYELLWAWAWPSKPLWAEPTGLERERSLNGTWMLDEKTLILKNELGSNPNFVGHWHNGELIEKGDPRLDERGNLRSASPDKEITPEVIKRIGGCVDRLGLVITTGGDNGPELVINQSNEEEGQSAATFLRTYEEAPAIAALHQAIAAQGRSIDDVADVSARNFFYESKPVEKDGKRWATCERIPLVFWKAIFTDRTRITLWWHNARQASLTYEQVKAMLDWKRLEFGSRQFLEGYVPQ